MESLQRALSTELPQSVQRALGKEAAQDLVRWLTNQLTLSRVHVSAVSARRKVNVFVLERVSNLFLANEPTLIQREDGNWVWLVPVDFTLPWIGRVGSVGELEVDARNGEIYYTQALLDEMADKAEALAEQVEAREK